VKSVNIGSEGNEDMLNGCLVLRKYRCKRKLFIMSSLTIGVCFSLYTLILVLVASVYSGPLDSDTYGDGHDARFDSRHHNRILQNSVMTGSDENRNPGMYNVKNGNGNHYPIFDRSEGRLSNLDNGGNVFADDEDIFKAQRKLVKEMDRGNKSKHLPHALIIGVKKAGTRALLEYLRMHPDVKAPGPEPHFFDKNYKKGLNWYR